jgi:hypothetical protein
VIDYPHWTEGPLPAEPSARIISDRIADSGHRLTTFEMKFHRFVLAEVNTHTLLSRNSASSRAIPLRSRDREARTGTLDRLEDNGPAFPIRWPLEQPGMQGADEEVANIEAARNAWTHAMKEAIAWAEALAAMGLHKSVANRIIEPYGWHVATISAVDWAGFFNQRSWHHSKMAQPEFAAVATQVEDLWAGNDPEPLAAGDFATPYIRPEEYDEFDLFERCKVSTARTARTSYLTHEGIRDVEADLVLYDRLATAEPAHASPFQHVATPDPDNEFCYVIDPADYGWPGEKKTMWVPIVGNCRGFMQLRHIVMGF